MQNKKTTVAGYFTLAIAVLHVGQAYFTGGNVGEAVNQVLALLPVGAGLVASSDGGH